MLPCTSAHARPDPSDNKMAYRRLLSFSASSSSVRPFVRRVSSYRERLAEEEAHAASVKQTWRMISLFVCVPTVGYFTWKNFIAGENEHHSCTYTPWSHLRIRTKPFPWGDGDLSLFHNPHTNPRPDGEPKKVAPSPTFRERVGSLWLEYLHEDVVKRDEARWEHLAKVQRRTEEYMARKRAKDVPIHPMCLAEEFRVHKPNPAHSGIDH